MDSWEKTSKRLSDSIFLTSLKVDGLELKELVYKKDNTVFIYTGKAPVIYFVVKGSYKVRANKKKFICKSGHGLIIYDREALPVEYAKAGTRLFSIELTDELLKREHAVLPTIKTHLFGAESVLNELMALLYREYEAMEKGVEHEVKGIFLQILGLIEREQPVPEEAKPAWARRLLRYLYRNLEEHITLTEIAQLLGMNEAYLSREVPRYYNCLFHELKMRVMLRKARTLLLTTKQTLGDIAYLCGFSTDSHLVNQFKLHFGMTPGEFRKMIPAKQRKWLHNFIQKK